MSSPCAMYQHRWGLRQLTVELIHDQHVFCSLRKHGDQKFYASSGLKVPLSPWKLKALTTCQNSKRFFTNNESLTFGSKEILKYRGINRKFSAFVFKPHATWRITGHFYFMPVFLRGCGHSSMCSKVNYGHAWWSRPWSWKPPRLEIRFFYVTLTQCEGHIEVNRPKGLFVYP